MQLAIDVDSDPISGSVCNGNQIAQPFTGWIELTAAIEAARTASHADGTPASAGEAGAKRLGSLPGANADQR